MRLDTYFKQKAQMHLSDEDKIRLYQQIMSKKSQVERWLSRRSLIMKRVFYSCLAVGLIFAFFGSYLWDNPKVQTYRAFWTQKIPSINIANADQVATILQINGEYIIEKYGKQFKNSVLFDWDLITLKAEAKILFDVNNDTKIEIQGPAQFLISKREQGGYHLNLISGDYISIEASKAESILELETDHLNIETQKDKAISLELSQKNHKLQLKNSGAELSIKNKKSSTPSEIQQLAQAKVLTIQENDISKIEDMATFQKLLTSNENITHTISFPQTGEEKPEFDLEEMTSLLKDFPTATENLSSEEINTINQQIATSNDGKKIPSETQLSHITAALNSKFLLDDLQQLFLAKKNGNLTDIQAINQRFEAKIRSIAERYEIKIGSSLALPEQITELLKGLEVYHLPPSKIHQLKTLKNWFTSIDALASSEQNWEEILGSLTSSLKFH